MGKQNLFFPLLLQIRNTHRKYICYFLTWGNLTVDWRFCLPLLRLFRRMLDFLCDRTMSELPQLPPHTPFSAVFFCCFFLFRHLAKQSHTQSISPPASIFTSACRLLHLAALFNLTGRKAELGMMLMTQTQADTLRTHKRCQSVP